MCLYRSEYCRWNSEQGNSGIFLIKNEPLAHDIIAEWNTVSETHPETKWKWALDQNGFNIHILPTYRDHIELVADYYLLHSDVGYFVRHLFDGGGYYSRDRMEAFAAIFNSPMMKRNRELAKLK